MLENIPTVLTDGFEEDPPMVVLVGQENLERFWPQVVPLLIKTQEVWEDFMTLESIKNNLIAGTSQLWCMGWREEGIVLAALTEIEQYPKQRVLRFWWMGGENFSIAIKFHEYMELLARREGITRIEVRGRKGWVRKLRSIGYEQDVYLVSKDVSGLREH